MVVTDNNVQFAVKVGCFHYVIHACPILGVVVTGFRVEGNNWTMIGKGDPQRAQVGHVVQSSVQVIESPWILKHKSFQALGDSTITLTL